MTTRTTPDFIAGMRHAANLVARMKARVSEADPLFATSKMAYGLVIGTIQGEADVVEAEVVAALRGAASGDAHGEVEAGYEQG